MKILTFDGKTRHGHAEHWIEQLEQNFDILRVLEDSKSNVVVVFLVVGVLKWWK